MRLAPLNVSFLFAVAVVPVAVSCGGPVDGDEGGERGGFGNGGASGTTGGTPTGGAPTAGSANGGVTNGGAAPMGGASGAAAGAGPSGGVAGAGVTGGSAGISGAAGSVIVAGSGGAPSGGAGGAGAGGTPGGTGPGGSGGFGGTIPPQPLDCGGKGTALENHGPPSNRVNYVIVADGYSEAELAQGGTLDTHLQAYMEKRFSAVIGQPYLRYRNFVNICVLRIASTPICGSSTFGCCGNDSSRLASCNSGAVNTAITQNLPASFEVDWRAVVLNGSSWWNTGSSLMLWSGGNRDASGAALHEGGHGFHQLADEYCARGTGASCGNDTCSGNGTNYNEVNSAGNCTTTDNKWNSWLDYNDTGATGVQGTFVGSRYVDSGQYRPSSNSMMNSLFGNNTNTAFNPVSREKMIFDIWRIIQNPWDSVVPPAGAVSNPTTLAVNVIDPNVIRVDWSVDGTMVAPNGGPTYNATSLTPGMHTVTARAYDNAGMDMVRSTGTTFNRQYWGSGTMGRSDKTVTWTVTKQ